MWLHVATYFTFESTPTHVSMLPIYVGYDTPLCVVSSSGKQKDTVTVLLRHRADPNIRAPVRCTAQHRSMLRCV